MDDSSKLQRQRELIVEEIASIQTIERGTLSEEYRDIPNPDGGGTLRRGPYFKHQCWENKRNRSRRVPASEVDLLREDLENARRFEQLVAKLAEINTEQARHRRADLSESEAKSDSKKNSGDKSSGKGTGKPKPSSRKSPRARRAKDTKT